MEILVICCCLTALVCCLAVSGLAFALVWVKFFGKEAREIGKAELALTEAQTAAMKAQEEYNQGFNNMMQYMGVPGKGGGGR